MTQANYIRKTYVILNELRHRYIYILGECKAFVGERAQRAEEKQGRLRLRVARGRMRTDRGRLMTYKHTYIHTYIQTKLPLSSLVRARCARPKIETALNRTALNRNV